MEQLSHRGHARAVLALGGPLIGSHLAQVALHVTDTLMLGWYGVGALAAAVLATSVFLVVFLMGSGFAWAVMPLVAAAAGAGADAEVRRAARMGMWLSILYGIACFPLMWFSGGLLELLGQAPATAGMAQAYLRIAVLGMVPALLVMVLKSYLAALERTQVVLWVTLAAVAVNAALNWALIFGNWGAPELGVRGAAVTTVLVQLVCFALLAGYAIWLPELRVHMLFHRFWRSDWQAFTRVFRLGWPIGLTNLAESGLFTASALMIGWIGTRELAAHGIAMEIITMIFMIHLGLSNAATIRAGRAFGQGQGAELRRGARVAVVLSLAVALMAVVLFILMPAPLVALFLSRQEPDRVAIIATGSALLLAAGVFQLADATQVMAMGLLRGVQDTRVPMVIAAISYWLVGIPASYILGFPLGLGAQGVWLGLALGLSLAALFLMRRFWRGAKAL